VPHFRSDRTQFITNGVGGRPSAIAADLIRTTLCAIVRMSAERLMDFNVSRSTESRLRQMLPHLLRSLTSSVSNSLARLDVVQTTRPDSSNRRAIGCQFLPKVNSPSDVTLTELQPNTRANWITDSITAALIPLCGSKSLSL
jgi:hypothetical protein